jgi:regulator of sirC expression with transglutaminase-like and TPR domain
MLRALQIWRDDFLRGVETTNGSLLESAMALSRYLQRGDVWNGSVELLTELEGAVLDRCAFHPLDDMDGRASEIMGVLCDYGFRGNAESYEDVANSFIDRVMQSRKGLPIALGVLSLHLADVAGIDLCGLGFPGHFLVGSGLRTSTPSIFDPFNDGRRLGFADLDALHVAATGVRMTSSFGRLRDVFRPLRRREILSRMLCNLQHHYASHGARERVADVADLLVCVQPDRERFPETLVRSLSEVEGSN